MVSERQIKLEAFDRRGWIPGPDEEEKAYLARVEALEHFFSHPPETIDCFLTDRDWESANARMEALYDCAADWIIAHYSNDQLSFFQGAATWIVRKKELRIPIIQLKEKFESGSLLKLYGRDEVLAHEAVHAVRMQFDEPKFEEIFAYRTSKRWWRRWFGPLFQKPWEAYLFIALLLFPLACEIFEILGFQVPYGLYIRLIPLVYFVWLLSRLLFYRWTLARALKNMCKGLLNPEKKWAAALRMTDREIFQFAFSKKEKLLSLWKGDKSPRITLLRQKFFKKIHD